MSKLSYELMIVLADDILNNDASQIEAALEWNVPKSTLNDFINRRSHTEFWAVWDSLEGNVEAVKAALNGKEQGKLKIWIYDIETAPMLGYVWQMWDNNLGLDQIAQDWHLLTWAGKWFGSDEILSDSCYRHSFNPKKPCDKAIVKSLLQKFDEADIVVAHNGNKFDQKKTNARAIIHGLKPPSPYKQIDTMLIAKGNFAFTSNKLDYIAKTLCGYGKMDTGGFATWVGCLTGDQAAWEKMEAYNRQDVEILENVWLALAPWDKKAPSYITHTDTTKECCTSPACGSINIKRTGKTVKTNTSEFIGYVCNDCGHMMRGRKNIRSKDQTSATLQNIA